jgi:uncharacterized membrane protein YqjE
MAQVTETRDGRQSEASVAELLKELSDQTTRLVHDEVELAKAELGEKATSAGLGAGMFGGAALFGLYALGALTATLILALSTAVAGWVAALIVTVVYGVIAGVLALTGRTKVQQATPPVPEQARDSVRRDIEETKAHARAGRR